jgi:hypothetical protein
LRMSLLRRSRVATSQPYVDDISARVRACCMRERKGGKGALYTLFDLGQVQQPPDVEARGGLQ